MNTEQLIDSLCLPESYPHSVEVITTIETHISVVFLTGPYAYKLKKPVDFGFLDFTQLDSRKHFCEQELRLNQRTAPNLYLDVVPLFLDTNGRITFDQNLAGGSSAKPIEYLLKMNQFDPNGVLGRYLSDHDLSKAQERELAKQISQLHLNARIVEGDSHLGEPKTILQPMLDNFPTLLENCTSEYKPRLENLLNWTHQRFADLQEDLVNRKKLGFVRECHGDLHLDNITLIDDRPTLFDGIEFNDEFRWIDVISDLAFLLIDLDFRDKQALRRRILSTYLGFTGDYAALKLLRFYQVYRALVRAKISALRLGQIPKNSIEYQHYRTITLQYIEQAEGYALTSSSNKLIVLQGVSGSGKSHFAEQLLSELDAVVISSDIERKRLYGISQTTRVPEEEKSTLYSAEMSRKTYAKLLALSKKLLEQGQSVIVDATFLKSEYRLPFYETARSLGCEPYLIYIETDTDTAEVSIRQRSLADLSPSDADEAVMNRQLEFIEPPSKSEPSLTLSAEGLRKVFPRNKIQEFLQLPLT